MNLVITGGTGFVSRWLLASLPEDHDALVLSRQAASPALDVAGRKFRLQATDYSVTSLRKAFAGADAVIHLAAQRHVDADAGDFLKNLCIDTAVFSACAAQDVTNIVFASSRAVYGSQAAPWTEQHTPQPETPYAVAKLQTEVQAAYHNRRGLHIKSLRIAQVLGFGERPASVVPTFLRNAFRGRPLVLTAAGHLVREYIYVKDLAIALLAAVNRPEVAGIFNLGSGEVITLEGLAVLINRVFANDAGIVRSDRSRLVDETSLMDSSRFREVFAWTPYWTMESACWDIRTLLADPAVVAAYGF